MKYIFFLLISLCLTSAQSKSSEEVVPVNITCYDTDTLLKTLREVYKEYPIAVGMTNDAAKSTTSIWVNPKDKSWTIVATKQSISCIIGVGIEFELVPYKNKEI